MGRMFGTDGVRGIANTELNCELAYKLGRAGAYVLTQNRHKPRILIGKDTRLSGDMLEAALVAGICSVGAEALCVGVIPTPAIAFLTRYYDMDAGVVISASHNPFEYNGIKFFNREGYKLSDELEDQIEDIIDNKLDELPNPTGIGVGRSVKLENASVDYVDFVRKTVNTDLEGMKIALDCANGASYMVAPQVFSQLGAEIFPIYNEPDGTNINLRCGSTHTNMLQDYVLETGVDLGLAFDGDADRVIAVDEKGNIVDGDKIMAICGLYLKEKGKLDKDTVVTTVMSNMGLDIALKDNGCNCVKTNVGDRYVIEEMKKSGFCFGGEQSGHIIFLEHNTTGDGIVTGLQLASIVKEKGEKLSELASVMNTLPQELINAKVSNGRKYDYDKYDEIVNAIKEIEGKFEGKGRVLIRPSGTEPLVRVMIEGQNKNEIKKEAQRLVSLIERVLN